LLELVVVLAARLLKLYPLQMVGRILEALVEVMVGVLQAVLHLGRAAVEVLALVVAVAAGAVAAGLVLVVMPEVGAVLEEMVALVSSVTLRAVVAVQADLLHIRNPALREILLFQHGQILY
jgi:hypothetical protein